MPYSVKDLTYHLLHTKANSIKLEQDVKAKETLLEQCYARMERGQPPSDDIEGEWLNNLKKEVTRLRATQERKKVRLIFQTFVFKTF